MRTSDARPAQYLIETMDDNGVEKNAIDIKDGKQNKKEAFDYGDNDKYLCDDDYRSNLHVEIRNAVKV